MCMKISIAVLFITKSITGLTFHYKWNYYVLTWWNRIQSLKQELCYYRAVWTTAYDIVLTAKKAEFNLGVRSDHSFVKFFTCLHKGRKGTQNSKDI